MASGRSFLSNLLVAPALSGKIIGLLAAVILLLLAVNVGTLVMNQRTIAYNDAVARSEQTRLAAKDLLILFNNAETGQRGYMLTAQQSYLDTYEEAIAAIPGAVARLDDLIGDDQQEQQHLEQFKHNYGQRLILMERTVTLNQQARIGEAVALVRSGQGKAIMDAMREDLGAIDRLEAKYLEDQVRKSERAARMTVFGNLSATFLILGLALLSIWLVSRYIREIQDAHLEVDRANAGLENEVRDRTAELVRANEEIQRFAYIVSHDLRAPLVNVMGYTSELEQVGHMLDGVLTRMERDHPELVDQEAAVAVREDVPEAVGFIRASTAKMDRLINAILKMSRDGRRPLTPEPLDMNVMLQSMADAVSHQLNERAGQVEVTDLPPLISDRVVIEQIFGNLIDNAVKYCQADRPLRVRIEGELVEDDKVAYRVIDNGRGISARDHERIFELFRRAGRQDRPGEGLGLAFVRNSVRRLGGSIDVESELGQGSTFHIKLPRLLIFSRVDGDIS